jgi:fluoride ion exporter CrcB/FEX
MALQMLSVAGALMVLAAYALIQSGVWRELDTGYLALNIVGSLLLGIVAIADRQAGFILLEFAWVGIAMIGVIRSLRARRTVR